MPRLAELNINLLPPKNRVRMSKLWTSVIMALAFLAVLFTCFWMWQSRALSTQEVENMRLKADLKSCEDQMTFYQPVQAMEQNSTIKVKELESIEKARVSYTSVINELDRVKPDQIIIVGAEIKPPRVIVHGFSPDHSNVSRMLEGIKASPIFNNVTLLSSEMNENTSEVQFIMEIEWEAAQK